MHPAFSVIIFTTLSGAGYGLLFWLGIYALAGVLPVSQVWAAIVMVIALAMVTVGLLSSMLHLGHPERAWRAFSQWRSSWLSREGVASTLTYAPALLFAAAWMFEGNGAATATAGTVTAVCAVITVICTAYIYRSLKPVPRWHNNWVVPNYLLLAAMSGSLLICAAADISGIRLAGAHILAFVSIVAAAAAKLCYWHHIDTMPVDSTPETATGLGHLGKVRLLEAPHTSENYLLKEMGFRIARKHAAKLRVIALILGFVAPFLLALVAFLTGGTMAAIFSATALALAFAGVLVERWLFFAEAKHAVTLYYGRSLSA